MFIKSCSSWWLLIVLVNVFASLCSGQERPVRILYYKSPASAPSETYVYVGTEMVAETKLPRSNFSETFEIPRGDVQLSFLPSPILEAEEMPVGMPTANIPEAWSKVLLMVFENKGNALMPISVKAINASDDVFAPGSIYIINFSSVGVFGTIGDKELKLQPKSVQILKNPIKENGYYPTKLSIISEKGAKPRRFVRQMWNHSDSIRRMLIIMPKEKSPFARYYSTPIRDF